MEEPLELESLYLEHGGALLAYLRRRFGANADDLLQEVFVQALRGGGLRRAVSARAFLFGIARHVGLSAARRERTMETLPELAAPEQGEHGDVEQMRAAIAKLPGEMRETLELRLREELTYEEIAGVLGIPVGTVRSRLHAAVKLLGAAMKKE